MKRVLLQATPRKSCGAAGAFTLFSLINTLLYNVQSGNLPHKFLCATADNANIPEKVFITYPLENFRYLKSRASTTMPLKPRSDERARGDLPRKSLCAATDTVTIPDM